MTININYQKRKNSSLFLKMENHKGIKLSNMQNYIPIYNNIFNLGNTDFLNVVEVADALLLEMNLKNVAYKFSGGERGWIGDSPFVHLDIQKISSLGWKPTYSIHDGIKRTVKYLLENPQLFETRH
jgi:nucleoside-diphosphate-sugar epimerase